MSIKTFIKTHTALVGTIAIIAIVLMTALGRMATKNTAEVSKSNVRQVTLVDTETFRDDLTTVAVEGVVESASQVDIKSQVSAPIAAVNYEVGDTVSAGQTIVEFQNADIRAQLEQARANVTLARGQYVTSGTAVDTARRASIDKIRDAYNKSDDIVNAQIGQFLYNGNPTSPQLQSYVLDSSISDALSLQWSEVTSAIQEWKRVVGTLGDLSTQTDVDAALALSEKNLGKINTFLGTLSAALVNATKGTGDSTTALVNGWKNTVTAARATVSGLISTLTSAGSTIVSNQAQVLAAEAGVKNLQAQLAKTIIIAPISGKIAALPYREGEFVSVGQLVTTIVGSGGLELKAFASSEDLDRIKKDAKVAVDGRIPGVVASVAPSVNQANKKIEVKILIPSIERVNLVVGQNVQARIEAPRPSAEMTSRVPVYILPIQNVKIIPGSAYVYTVDVDSKIVKHAVTLGEVRGDFVEVKTGITDGMKIVSPVYELEEGQVVRTE